MCPKQPGAFFMSPSVIQLRMIFRTKPCQSYLGFREGWKWNEVVTGWKSPNVQETNCTRKKKKYQTNYQTSPSKKYQDCLQFLESFKGRMIRPMHLMSTQLFENSHPKQKDQAHEVRWWQILLLSQWPPSMPHASPAPLLATEIANPPRSSNTTSSICARTFFGEVWNVGHVG